MSIKRWVLTTVSIALGIPVAIVAFVWAVGIAHYYASGEAGFARKFHTIKVGHSKDEVVALLGTPDYEGKEFHLGQKEGFELAYEKAANTNSKYYLFWNRGIDTRYTVGFDAQENVTIAEYGGT